MAQRKEKHYSSPDEKKETVLTAINNKPGFLEWLEKTDFTHMLEESQTEEK